MLTLRFDKKNFWLLKQHSAHLFSFWSSQINTHNLLGEPAKRCVRSITKSYEWSRSAEHIFGLVRRLIQRQLQEMLLFNVEPKFTVVLFLKFDI